MSRSNNNPVTIDGIVCYKTDVASNHDDYDLKSLDNIRATESSHFWFSARRELIMSIFKKYITHNSRFMEIGAGTGFVSKGLLDMGYDVSAGELHFSGLKYAQESGIEKLYQFDLYDPPFSGDFDVIGLFDVIEHLEHDELALSSVRSILSSTGKIVITVPAHMWLWSQDDVSAKHKRRYTLKQLLNLVEKSGFNVLEARYFFISILPLLVARRFVNPARPLADKSSGSKNKPGTGLIYRIYHKVLHAICNFENKYIKYYPNIAGGSIYLIAERTDNENSIQ